MYLHLDSWMSLLALLVLWIAAFLHTLVTQVRFPGPANIAVCCVGSSRWVA